MFRYRLVYLRHHNEDKEDGRQKWVFLWRIEKKTTWKEGMASQGVLTEKKTRTKRVNQAEEFPWKLSSGEEVEEVVAVGCSPSRPLPRLRQPRE